MSLASSIHKILKKIEGLIEVLTLVLCIQNLITMFADYSVYAELLSHFQSQYFVLFFCSLVFFAFTRNILWIVISLWGVCLNMGAISFEPSIYSVQAHAPAKPKLKILISNVLTKNRKFEKIFNYIELKNPDILALVEVDKKWMKRLAKLNSDYPYHTAYPRFDNFGLALFSKYPISSNLLTFSKNQTPAIEAHFDYDNKPISLLLAHPIPPGNNQTLNMRNQYLENAGIWASEQTHPIIAGDLNITPYSPFYREVLMLGNLTNTRNRFGTLPSWPTGLPFFKIPIDHCLVGTDFFTHTMEIGPDIGSDHLPIYVELSI